MLSRLRRLLTRSESAGVASGDSTYPFVYVEVDGAARELHASERTYLETEFEGGDGARPYVKSAYGQRNGWGELSGFLYRSEMPPGNAVKPAPSDDPTKPFNGAFVLIQCLSSRPEPPFEVVGVDRKPLARFNALDEAQRFAADEAERQGAKVLLAPIVRREM